MSKSNKYLIISIFIVLGISALAAGSLPFSFKAGEPIKADEVNANFQALADGKQNTITNSPCTNGQFVTGVGADGKLSCGIDQIGSAGSSGVSSLNGKTGSLSIEGGDGVTVETSEDGKVMISAGVSEGVLETQATLTFPFSKAINNTNPAFAITNNGGTALSGSSRNGAGVYAFSSNNGNGLSAYSEKNYGVLAFTNIGIAGVYGEGKINGGTGVRGVNNAGTGSSGIWGESAAGRGVRGNSITGSGVEGTSTSGYGVKGTVTTSGTGVYGENTSSSAGAGVQGKANSVNSVGVQGNSTAGTGVSGLSNTNVGVSGTILSNTAGVNSVAINGVNNGVNGYGVRGIHNGNGFGVYGNSKASGVGGESTTGIGVYGKGPTAMYAAGNVKQELGFGGWAKAMIYVSVSSGSLEIDRCFNSQATGALVNSNGCGFTLTSPAAGEVIVNFGFDVSQRFVGSTLHISSHDYTENQALMTVSQAHPNNSSITVDSWFSQSGADTYANFTLIIF